jgi:uncharacterized protein
VSRLTASLLTFCVFTSLARAEIVNIPSLTSPVIDEAALLTANEARRIEDRLYSFKDAFQMQVWIAPTLGDESIEALSIRAVDKWKLGAEKTDKGLLLLIAVKERRMRLEVGHGLEGDIPDALSARILDQLLRPALRSGNFSQGINEVIDEVSAILNVGDHPQQRHVQGKGGSFPALFIILLPFIVFVVLGRVLGSVFGFRSRRRYPWDGGFGGGGGWGGGGFGGGSGGGWSGGGGSFGGGGSSSNW